MNNNGKVVEYFGYDVIRGLLYTHNRAKKNTAQVHNANATLHAMIELLLEKGIIDKGELGVRQTKISKILKKTYIQQGMAVAMQEFDVSKYEFKGRAETDCDNYIPLCKAACCKLPLALSKEDVQEGIIRWELGNPYIISHNGSGYCAHMIIENFRCKVYDHRPIPCRGYDCRKDERVWLDFKKRIINPHVNESDWPESLSQEEKHILFGEAEYA